MPQLSSFFEVRRILVCGLSLFAVGAGTACDRSNRVASTDSLLMRDLTLAGSSAAPATTPSLGDTATTIPAARAPLPPPLSVSTKKATSAPSPQTTPSRVAARPTQQVAPTSAPSPVVAEPAPQTAPAPVLTPATTVDRVGAGAGTQSDGADGAAAGTTSRGAIGVGSTLSGKTGSQICSLANRPGDRLVANLAAEMIASDGSRLAAGTPILIEMAAPATPGDFAFRVKAVQVDGVLIPVQGTVVIEGVTSERRVSKGGDQGKVITGAIAGAILGRVLGGGTKGAVIGAAGGAAAGTAAAARNSVTERCLPAGATVTVTLSAPLVLSPGVL